MRVDDPPMYNMVLLSATNALLIETARSHTSLWLELIAFSVILLTDVVEVATLSST